MSLLPTQRTGASRLVGLGVFAVSVGLTFALSGSGQVSPEDHAKHHPGQDKAKTGAGPDQTKDKAGMPGMAAGGKEPAKGTGRCF